MNHDPHSIADSETLLGAICEGLEVEQADITESYRRKLERALRQLLDLGRLELEAVRAASYNWRRMGWEVPLSPERLVEHWPELAAFWRCHRPQPPPCEACGVANGQHAADCETLIPP